MLRKIKQLFKNKKGQGLTEYAVILGIVVLIGSTIAANDSFKSSITSLYQTVGKSLGSLGDQVHDLNWNSANSTGGSNTAGSN